MGIVPWRYSFSISRLRLMGPGIRRRTIVVLRSGLGIEVVRRLSILLISRM